MRKCVNGKKKGKKEKKNIMRALDGMGLDGDRAVRAKE